MWPPAFFAFWGPPAKPKQAPNIPAPYVVYAIGDIHGEIAALEQLLETIAAHARTLPASQPILIFLGDYVDRGRDSRSVIERLSRNAIPGFSCRFLLGNHEAAMLEFLHNPIKGAPWLSFGGIETLASYGIRTSVGITSPDRCRQARDRLAAILPHQHLSFLQSLELYAVIGDYVFVHAGLRPGRPLCRQRREDLLWIREPFLSSRRRHEKLVVHGHTITSSVEITPNRIGIDTGAYLSGELTALSLWGDQQQLLSAHTK